jgi:DNA-binding response OmpR family regulator
LKREVSPPPPLWPPVAHLLLVEDHPAILSLFERWLTQDGYDVIACCHFEDAKLHLNRAIPDALITDVRLGQFNGLHLAWELRGLRPTSPILVMTAYDDNVLRHEAERCGAVYWVKTSSREDFFEAFHLAAHRRTRENDHSS